MNIGDKIYYVAKKYNSFSRQKITVVDENGIEWYRYDKPAIELILETHTIVGKIESIEYGIVPEEERCEEATYFTDLEQVVYASEIDEDINTAWFSNEQHAVEFFEYERKKYAH